MRLIYPIKKKLSLAVMASLIVSGALSQTTSPAATKVTSGYNQLATLLLIVTIVLAFVLWGLGQVLAVLGKQLLDKSKNTPKVLGAVLVTVLLFASQAAAAQDAAKNAVIEVPNYGGLSATTFYMFVTVIATEIAAILFVAFSIRRIYTELLPQKQRPAANPYRLKEWWSKLDKKIFTKAIPVEREADFLLDHDYDGIQELDNALPPWWKYGFYITILVAFVYLLNFHVLGNGKNPTQEYVAEMEDARIETEIRESKNKNRIDENNIPMADATGLVWAKTVFMEPGKCISCHGNLGQGISGPNVTDDYWIHGGSLNDIYKSIKNGYPEKGMTNWSALYTPKEISFLASYVKSLHGTKPAGGLPPQGDLYAETTAASTTDTAKIIQADSAVIKKITGVDKPASAKTGSQK